MARHLLYWPPVKWLVFPLVVLAACSPKGPAKPTVDAPHLVATSELAWYRVDAGCAQGPFEIELAATGTKYGEIAELELHTTHAVALEVAVLVDGREVDRVHGVFDQAGPVAGQPANAKCVASDRDKLVQSRPGGTGGTNGGTNVPASAGSAPALPPPSTTAPPLVRIDGLVPQSTSIVTFHVPRAQAGRIKVRFWSIEPNDLTDVAFGFAHVVMRPNIGESAYDQYLADREARMRVTVSEPARVITETAEDRARNERAARDASERARHDEEERIARERQAAIDAALAEERERRHRSYCDAHHDDRDCWGPGGFAGYHELELRARERERYCAANAEDARCWSSNEWQQRRAVWSARVQVALRDQAAAQAPKGPPPAPLEDSQPPQPSLHAEWRAGYWSWDEGQWVWLAGQWNVPDQDVLHEQTATAPQPPPPPNLETPPPPPVHAVVWIPGYWMWNRTQWNWSAGSYQLAQTGRSWSPPRWRMRGSVHVFIPGGWLSR